MNRITRTISIEQLRVGQLYRMTLCVSLANMVDGRLVWGGNNLNKGDEFLVLGILDMPIRIEPDIPLYSLEVLSADELMIHGIIRVEANDLWFERSYANS